ncbi:uncharacterized protein LOC108679610 isoform X2 [Hyalella azteca]|uniref:Uncharacterized protein LOC108679610 isoform X2 n=1 Tax=Hyalella azteca TaxID=294128 RepID=A0A8B7PCL6_HYAAZ|nr:uncharacterized protein LOC108679610 isoform X2 [Hyalella azteca]
MRLGVSKFKLLCCFLWSVLSLCSPRLVSAASGHAGDDSRPRENSVRFLAPQHQWNTNEAFDVAVSPIEQNPRDDHDVKCIAVDYGVIKAPDKKSKIYRRTKRKVISRGGYYLLSSKSGGSPWLNPSSGGSGTFQRNSRGAWSGRGGMGRGYGDRNRGRQGGRRGGGDDEGRGRNGRKKITQNLKMEIGQYAQQKGVKAAAEQYEGRVGRKLKERIVEKFARRYRIRQEQRSKRGKDGKKRLKGERN